MGEEARFDTGDPTMPRGNPDNLVIQVGLDGKEIKAPWWKDFEWRYIQADTVLDEDSVREATGISRGQTFSPMTYVKYLAPLYTLDPNDQDSASHKLYCDEGARHGAPPALVTLAVALIV